MSDDALVALAEAAGIEPRWIDYRGVHRQVAASSLRRVLAALQLSADTPAQIHQSTAQLQQECASGQGATLITATQGEPVALPADCAGHSVQLVLEDGRTLDPTLLDPGGPPLLPALAEIGYHRLRWADREITLAVAPPRCPAVRGRTGASSPARIWGLCAQLYALRRAGDGGIGDYSALETLARRAAAHGADALAVSPVHAPFTADMERFSPYSPSSRLLFNPLHIDPAEAFGPDALREVLDRAGSAEAYARLEFLPLVDWPAASRLRLEVLRALYAQLDQHPALQAELRQFRVQGGTALEHHARFEALHAHRWELARAQSHWQLWPMPLRSPRAPEVETYAQAHAGEVGFHAFLQWLADRGLRRAQAAARAGGMSLGLLADLAVGSDGAGSQAWSQQETLLNGLSVGAPPDMINALGQSWGLVSFSPRALRRSGYAAYRDMLRAAMRHAGGLRIDHVMGLARLWLVPDGEASSGGAYLRYPFDDLLRLLALEAHRAQCVIVGEDLGTVPEGFRDRLAQAGVLGMRVLWFEHDHGLFVDPSRWPANAMATPTTHDLPSIAGWWQGRDIHWRAQTAQLDPERSEEAEQALRAADRERLWNAFLHAGVAQGAPPPADDAPPVVDAALRFVARTPAPLALVPVEDLLGSAEQPNLPGTVDAHPNWRRRLHAPVESLLDTPPADARLALLRQERGPA